LLEKVYFRFYSIFLMIYIIFFMLTKKIDIVIERNSAKGSGVLPAKLFGILAVLEIIDPEVSRIQLKLADRILAYTKKIVPPDYLQRISLTDAGVETEIFKPDKKGAREIRKRFNLNGRKVVVYVGELSAWHGAEIIIELAERMRDVTFLMLGKNLQLLSEEVMRRKLGNVIFAGFVDHSEVRKYISTGDAAIAPYRKLSKVFYFSPIKIFEYMACGVPFVASDIEIIREIAKKHQCGLLAEQNDVDDFAVKLNLLLENSRLRDKLSKNGRKAAVRYYSWDKVAEKILQSFE
jgi:glycosyltransferase involved in cell wall biosynthesis